MTRVKQTRLYILPSIHAKLHKVTRIERQRREEDGLSYRRFGLVDMVELLLDEYLAARQHEKQQDEALAQYLAENAPQQPPADSG